jgi:dTDP-4-dehydrorhamnose reductase
MRILLTGITGQLGHALRTSLASLGTVVAADRTLLDLSRPSDVPDILNGIAPDLIINPAAYTAVDQAEDESALAYRVNAEAPGALAEWATSHDVPMVHFSTDYVFDGSGDQPWREDDLTGPLSVYGASKLAGEIAIRKAGGSHLIIRTSWVFASRGKNFLNTIVRLARERSEIRIVADQVGAPTSARAVANGLSSILASGRADGRKDLLKQKFDATNGLVHITASGATSWHGFASAIVDGLRNRGVQLAVGNIVAIKTEEFPTKAKRPRNSRLDLGRAERIFGIKMPSWRDALDLELDAIVEPVDEDN